MDEFVLRALFLHVVSGFIALVTGAIALFATKGKSWHKHAGKIYFLAMTSVFFTGIVVAGFRHNKFLFLIAFLSYYSVFAGIRSLKLKKLHKNQRPEWYDWGAGIVNGFVNIAFFTLGLTYFFDVGLVSSIQASLMCLGFGAGGFAISYTNLKQFVVKPNVHYHWYLAHTGNMMGGYIATITAFLATMVSRFDFGYPFLAFILPALIGIPILQFWQNREVKKFERKAILR